MRKKVIDITKQELYEFKDKMNSIRKLDDQIKTLESMMQKTTSKPTGMPKGSNDRKDKYAEYAARHEELKDMLDEKVKSTFGFMCELERLLDKKDVTGIQQMVIRLRYVDALEWKEVAKKIKYAESSVYKIHGVALKRMGIT